MLKGTSKCLSKLLKRFRTIESTLSLHVTSIDHASHVHVKTYTNGQKLQNCSSKIRVQGKGKMLITPPGHPQKLRLLDARINNSI